MRIPTFHRRSENDVATTPMIDVVFLLLIFFICTASFQIAENVLPSSLLAAGNQPTDVPIEIEPPLEHIIVRTALVDGRPIWSVNERPCQALVAVRAVLTAVYEIDTSVPVILDIDGDVPLGDAINVYDLCRSVGFDQVQFAAEDVR